MSDEELVRLLNTVYAAGVVKGVAVLGAQRVDDADDAVRRGIQRAFKQAEADAVSAARDVVLCCYVCERTELERSDIQICCMGCRSGPQRSPAEKPQ